MASITSSSDEARGMKWFAVSISAATWCIGTLCALVRGLNVADSVALGGISALGGLLAWLIYHALSRRNDGLAILIVAFIGTLSTSQTEMISPEEEFAKQSVNIVRLAIVAAAFGAFSRFRSGQYERPTHSPLWDAEVDRPGPG